ncbi:Kelch-like protein 34 [Larimichthys crocea]|uniref:Kelch-like protein 34 n=1 Tax=Larimichthys crocea TaxID=215358 RepID=A0A6G0HKU5_LARCR|nr:Kelch-like protein 34 [Larimichthys crocea]
MDSYSLLYSSSHRTGLLSGFQRLRSQRKMCDVVLEAGGVSFPCHRALLASSSDVSPPTLPVVLAAARYLQVEPAVAICERFITDGLSAENCCSYANLAEHHALSDALEAANQTVAMEMGTLLQDSRDDLLGLNVQSLMAVLDADEIPGVKEVELIKLALDWLNENGPLPLLKSNLLLSRLRFGLVAPCDLTDLSHAHRAMATPLIRSQLTRALEYHRLGSAQPIRQSRQSTLRASPNRVLLVGGGSGPDWPEQQILAFPLRDRRRRSEGRDEDGKKSVTTAMSNQVWRYDPRFSSWEKVESMLERRAQFTCCVVEDVIYAIGGRNTRPGTDAHTSVASVEFYDMASGGWRRGAAMPRPLYGHASAVLHDCIYVSGGVPGNQGTIDASNHGDNQDDHRGSSREVLSWDLKGKVWEKRASMSIARSGHRLATAHGHIYALLGMYEPFCDIEQYDSQSDHWTRLRPLLTGSFNYGMASTPSGNLLVFGGRRWSDGREVIVKSVLEYDTKKDRWREICQLPRPLTGTECTLLPLPD